MSEFSLGSNIYFSNLANVTNHLNPFNEQKFAIIINDSHKIELPAIIAASASKKVAEKFSVDPFSKELRIKLKIEGKNSEAVEKIQKAFNCETVLIENTEEKLFFAEFGLSINNDDFVRPIRDELNSEHCLLTKENVIGALLKKERYGCDTNEEISFIAQNFERLHDTESFIKFSNSPENFDIVEKIVSNENLRLKSEDALLSFVLSLSRNSNNNGTFFSLFDYVFLQYCSTEMCEEFLKFLCELLPEHNMYHIVSCLSKRLLQQNIPCNPKSNGKRYKYEFEKVDENETDDQMNGILWSENNKENVLLEASSVFDESMNVYNILEAEQNVVFRTKKDSENPFIKASLKDGKAFNVKSYSIKGDPDEDGNQSNSWCLEGQLALNGDKWMNIDKRIDCPLSGHELQSYNVDDGRKFKSVRLVDLGENNQLCINAFDIFGEIFE